MLATFGFHDVSSVDISGFALDKNNVAIGEDFTFSFDIMTKEATKVRLEYGIDYVKSNGKRNRKIFQISELSFAEDQKKRTPKSTPLKT